MIYKKVRGKIINLFLVILIVIPARSQVTKPDSVVKHVVISKVKTSSVQSIKYYFLTEKVDSSIFDLDTLKFSLTSYHKTGLRIEIKSDSTFCLYYNISLDTAHVEDSLGGIIVMITDKSDKIKGSWISDNIEKCVALQLNDLETYYYQIKKEGNFIEFIKNKP